MTKKDSKTSWNVEASTVEIPVPEAVPEGRKTNYWETLMHIHKSNMGPGIFAMGDAFKNAGLYLAPPLIFVIGSICIFCQHLLLNVCDETEKQLNITEPLSYEHAARLCFEVGHERWRHLGKFMGRLVTVFLCIAQSGFCCVYMVFIAENVNSVWNHYFDEPIGLNVTLAMVAAPMVVLSWIQDIKRLAPMSVLANILMTGGIVIVLGVAIPNLPDPSERLGVTHSFHTIPLFFGSVVYTFEGIGLVTPLKKRSKRPELFAATLGPLNVAMFTLASLMIVLGFIGYLRWGDDVQGSLTLNLDHDSVLGITLKLVISLGVLFTYPLQINPAIAITFGEIKEKWGPFRYPRLAAIAYRTLYTLFLFTLAEIIPHLSLFISLVGAVSSSALAVIIPPLMDLTTFHDRLGRCRWRLWRNCFVILFGIVGFLVGSTYSVINIVHTFMDE